MGIERPFIHIPQAISLRLLEHPQLALALDLQIHHKRHIKHHPTHVIIEAKDPLSIIPEFQLCDHRA